MLPKTKKSKPPPLRAVEIIVTRTQIVIETLTAVRIILTANKIFSNNNIYSSVIYIIFLLFFFFY